MCLEPTKHASVNGHLHGSWSEKALCKTVQALLLYSVAVQHTQSALIPFPECHGMVCNSFSKYRYTLYTLLDLASNEFLLSVVSRCEIRLCSCPLFGSVCAEAGVLPSTPEQPRLLFDTALLDLFYNAQAKGSISRQAYTNGIRNMIERNTFYDLIVLHEYSTYYLLC